MQLVQSRKQTAELEVQELEGEQPLERIKHINDVLRAICAVNKLIMRENDRGKLLKGVCKCLIDTRCCYNAWIVLLDESGGLVTTAEAGLGKDFLPVIEQLKRGELTDCSAMTLDSGRGTMTLQVEHDGKVYGLFSVCPRDFVTDEEEQALFREVALDIGFALHSIDLEEERKRAQEEKKKLESQLKYAQRIKALGTLAGGVAHNFNNILTVIQGNTSLMLFNTHPTHPHYERLRNIEKSVQRGAKLTSHLLGYAREGKYKVKPINMNQVLKETSDAFGETKKDIRLHRDLAGDLWGIEGDQGQIEQVLLNLYANAADAMPTGGELFLKTMNVTHEDMGGKPFRAKPGNYVFLAVSDTGTGMDEEALERIFDPFFTTKGLAKGTGLGLASAYGIIKAHGGYIDADSEKGHGTSFEIYLPASEKNERNQP